MDDDRLLRFGRQILLPEIDVAGQERLAAARVAVVGLGGLGSAAVLYLAAAGVGRLRLCDDDVVEASNLQRQVLHGEDDLGRPKTASGRDRIRALDPALELECVPARVGAGNAAAVVDGADLVVDGTDNVATRYLLNRACLDACVPWVSAAAIRFDAQLTLFDPRDAASPCYRCLWPEEGEAAAACAETGVVAPLVGVVGALQALEAVKLLAGCGRSLVGRVLSLDARSLAFDEFRLARRRGCADCG